MKITVLTLCYTLSATVALGQGYVNFVNTGGTTVSTNAVGTGGGSGPTATAPAAASARRWRPALARTFAVTWAGMW